jgi:hypothetical protein
MVTYGFPSSILSEQRLFSWKRRQAHSMFRTPRNGESSDPICDPGQVITWRSPGDHVRSVPQARRSMRWQLLPHSLTGVYQSMS